LATGQYSAWTKSDVVSRDLEKQASFLSELKANKASIDQIGLSILCKSLKETDIKKVEELLSFLQMKTLKRRGKSYDTLSEA